MSSLDSLTPGTNDDEPRNDLRLAALRTAIDEGGASDLAEDGSFARVRARVRIPQTRPELILGDG